MKRKLSLSFLGALCMLLVCISCSKDTEEELLSDVDLNTIDYFKEIALGFEFGNASEVTRKWDSDMKLFIGGNPSQELLAELDAVKNEINTLVTDGFQLTIVNDSTESNFYVFFGTGNDYSTMFPSQTNLVGSNLGLFSIFWDNTSFFTYGHMYVDIERTDPIAQKHLLREELTQSLGLAKDSSLYPLSIFQSEWTTTNSYTPIDRAIIQLLYHPDMRPGLDATAVDPILRDILSNN